MIERMSEKNPSVIQGPFFNQARVCEPILRALPEWFGIEAAIRRYLAEVDTLPTFLAVIEEKAVGFLTLKYHFEHAAEIYVMGLRPDSHRHGLGRALVVRAEELLRSNGVEYLGRKHENFEKKSELPAASCGHPAKLQPRFG